MPVCKPSWPILLATIVLATPVQADDWVTATAGGSTIELPGSLLEGSIIELTEGRGSFYGGPVDPMIVRQYRVDSTERPFDYLGQTIALLISATLESVNEDDVGIVSGFGRDEFYYAACRRAEGRVWCIDIILQASKHRKYSATVERIAASFLNDTGGGLE